VFSYSIGCDMALAERVSATRYVDVQTVQFLIVG
jgi:hypothetical protein